MTAVWQPGQTALGSPGGRLGAHEAASPGVGWDQPPWKLGPLAGHHSDQSLCNRNGRKRKSQSGAILHDQLGRERLRRETETWASGLSWVSGVQSKECGVFLWEAALSYEKQAGQLACAV